MKKRIIWIAAAAIVLIPLLIWGGSLIKCEVLTAKYHDAFADAYGPNAMLGIFDFGRS